MIHQAGDDEMKWSEVNSNVFDIVKVIVDHLSIPCGCFQYAPTTPIQWVESLYVYKFYIHIFEMTKDVRYSIYNDNYINILSFYMYYIIEQL